MLIADLFINFLFQQSVVAEAAVHAKTANVTVVAIPLKAQIVDVALEEIAHVETVAAKKEPVKVAAGVKLAIVKGNATAINVAPKMVAASVAIVLAKIAAARSNPIVGVAAESPATVKMVVAAQIASAHRVPEKLKYITSHFL